MVWKPYRKSAYTMGVNWSTSNVLVMGDLGRLPLQAKIFNNNINYLKYLTNKENISLVKQAYLYEKRKSEERITIENSLPKLATQYAPPEAIPNVITESKRSLKKKINKLFEEKWRTKMDLFLNQILEC